MRNQSPRRRDVLAWGATGLVAVLAGRVAGSAQTARPDALSSDLVREFVSAAHVDLEKTQALLRDYPGLLNATYDWGGGDFEAAIGGAGHVGRADIAEWLIGQGARWDVCVAAMLGRLEIVRATIEAYPETRSVRGPHGITLIRHAERGGERAREVVEYLRGLD